MSQIDFVFAADGGGSKTRTALQAADGTFLGEQLGGPCSLARFRQAFPDVAVSRLSTDGHTSLSGATGGEPGGLSAIGTGVGGYRLHHDGKVQKGSGWGFPVGDRGSGAGLDWRAIGDWLEWRDGYADQAASPVWYSRDATLGTTAADILGWLKPARPADVAD